MSEDSVKRPFQSHRRRLLQSVAAASVGVATGRGLMAQPVTPPARVPPRVPATLISGPVVFDARYMGSSITAADALSGLSMGWARTLDQIDIWRDMNPARGVFRDGGLRAWLDAMKARGAKTMFTLCSTPTWASARPTEGADAYGTPGGRAEPADPVFVVEFMQWLLSTYGADLDAFEFVNEPKYTYSGNPPGSINASYFSGTPQSLVTNLAKPSYDTIKALAPHIQIAGPACTGVTFGDPGSGIDYINRFLNASDGAGKLGKDYIDILSLHTYVHDGVNTLTVVKDIKPLLANLKAANGISAMPVYATEYGFIDPPLYSYQTSMALKAQYVVNYAIRNRAAGVDVNIGYGSLAFANDPTFIAAYNEWCGIINGATMTICQPVQLSNDLRCVINNVLYVIPGPPIAA